MESRACFFKLGRAGRHRAVFTADECRYSEVVANLAEHRSCNVREVFRSRTAFYYFVDSVSPRSRIVDFMEFAYAGVNSSPVHVNDILAFLAVALNDGVFQVFNSVFQRNNFCQCEERSLHYHVDAGAEPSFWPIASPFNV